MEKTLYRLGMKLRHGDGVSDQSVGWTQFCTPNSLENLVAICLG